MPDPLSLARTLVAEDFILANGTLVLLKPLAPGQSTVTAITLTVGAAAVAVGGVSIPLTVPLPEKIYAGIPIQFGAVTVIPTTDVAAGVSAILIEPAPAAIVAAATATTLALIPLYSANDSTTEGGETIVTSSNFQSGEWDSQRIARLNWKIPVTGDFIINDPGALAIRQAWSTRSKLYAEIHNAGGQGGDKGTGFVSGYRFQRKQNENCTIGFTLVGDGALGILPIIP